MAGSAFDRVNGVLVDRVILVDSEGAAITEDNPAYVSLSKNPLTTDYKLRVGSMPYGYDVAEGQIAGHTTIFKTGFNGDVDAAEEDLWPYGGSYVYPAAEQGMEVVSSDNTNDKAGGTGALTVMVWYVTSAGVEKTEVVTLNGTSAVNTDATDIFRINAFRVMTAGTSGAAAGTIDIRNKTDHTTVYSRISAGLTRARSSVYRVPAGKALYITQLSFSCGHSSGGRYCRFTLRATYDDFAGTVSTLFYPYYEIGVQDGSSTICLDFPIKFPAGVDVKLSVIGDAGNADAICTGAYRGWLEDVA